MNKTNNATMSFFDQESGLDLVLQKALNDQQIIQPRPIQQRAIPVILSGQDCLACSPTGSGKTLAFVLPALQKLLDENLTQDNTPKILILSPTRELANQIYKVVQDCLRYTHFNATLIVGGTPYGMHYLALQEEIDILIATPGRLIELDEKELLDLTEVQMMIVDEADRMLDMGFIEDIKKIASLTPVERQTLMFSATLESEKIQYLASDILGEDVKTIMISTPREVAENIQQIIYQVENEAHRENLLKHLISQPEIKQALVFVSTRKQVGHWVKIIRALHIFCDGLHGEMQQSERSKCLKDMNRGRLKVLVATDIAARGLDVSEISHVINLQLPQKADTYVHRAGRAGRNKTDEKAWCLSLVDTNDWAILERIQRYLKTVLPREKVPGLEPTKPEPVVVKKSKIKKSKAEKKKARIKAKQQVKKSRKK